MSSDEEKESLIIEAALEFGADYVYFIKNGTLGKTLYIEAATKDSARHIRQQAPTYWKELYVVVLRSSR